jgi:7-cyano-7-deazaguanine synthase
VPFLAPPAIVATPVAQYAPHPLIHFMVGCPAYRGSTLSGIAMRFPERSALLAEPAGYYGSPPPRGFHSMRKGSTALVLFSGGQDSTVCLAQALTQHALVETVGFTYGQRHVVELTARHEIRDAIPRLFPKWAKRLGTDHVFDLPAIAQMSETSLTRDIAIEMSENGLPNTFVPGRNLLFFTYAAAYAYRRGISRLIGGMGEADYSGYPDCRDDTIQALAAALVLGMGRDFLIETPLMRLDKAGIWALGDRLGGPTLTKLIVDSSHTCYRGTRDRPHAWGYGCGTCPACTLRKRGHTQWLTGNS